MKNLCRNWILPFLITLIAAIVLIVLLAILDMDTKVSNFIAGWICGGIWYISREHYTIKN